MMKIKRPLIVGAAILSIIALIFFYTDTLYDIRCFFPEHFGFKKVGPNIFVQNDMPSADVEVALLTIEKSKQRVINLFGAIESTPIIILGTNQNGLQKFGGLNQYGITRRDILGSFVVIGAIKPLALRCIYDAAQVVKIPIMGVGGVTNGRDVAEMFMAGAAAVQVCTEAILKGPNIYGQIVQELDAFLDSHGYGSVEEIRGLTIRKMAQRSAHTGPVLPEVDSRKCNLCGRCEISCAYNAISRAGQLKIDQEKCFGCGLCISRCKQSALRMPNK